MGRPEEQRRQVLAEKMRVHILAKELNVPSKSIIDKCKAEGIDSVKNHMSTLSAGLHATICEWFSEGQLESALETAKPVDLNKVRIKKRKPKAAEIDETPADEESIETDETIEVAERAEPDRAAAMEPAAAAVAAETPAAFFGGVRASQAAPAPDVEPARAEVAEPAAPPPAPETAEPDEAPELDGKKPRQPIKPAGPQNVPTAAKLQGPRVVRYEAPEYDVGAPRRGPRRDPAVAPGEPAPAEPERGARKKGKVAGRRGSGRVAEAGEPVGEWRDRDLAERRERLAGATGRRIHRRKTSQSTGGTALQTPVGPKTRAVVHEPVRMKEFCSETGLNFVQLFKVLRDQFNVLGNVNMILPNDTAQLLALHYGIELEVVPARTALDELHDEYQKRERANLQPRPPVVTLLGHVDHGKTSLMDRIRKSRLTASEDGGITQHIGSYHLQTPRGAVTFLDTPGHEAFTAMRARGAQLTDVVVLVVAADDGVMPQTIEAIRHAQAAKVPIVVALNKIDLGDQNKLKIYGQLSEHGLAPGEWGGETDVIATSTVTNVGVSELVEHLAELSSLLELKADPALPAHGTVIEAQTKPGVGAVAQVLVQEGTIRVGDFVVCGNAFGKIRALLDDRANRLLDAGPGVPVEVWGLDDVPASGDGLFAVENLQRAKEIASETKRLRLESSRVQTRKIRSLADMLEHRTSEEVPELNVIIKADVDGSLAALRHALGEIPSDEVRLGIRHAAVGPVNDSDILLAATAEAIIIAFRVETSVGARRLAEQHGVDVRGYRVIYDVVDDIRKALSGMLAPEERIESRAAAEVRQVFRVGKVGIVAGSYVTQGTIDRGHFAKIVRDGVVVRDMARIGSLRHLKDDVREVRAGMECGIRLEGFDDIHEGDRIETFEVLKIARTL